jgi:hypothetical protein
MKSLHEMGPDTVILTSTYFEHQHNLVLMASYKNGANFKFKHFILLFPYFSKK